MTQSSFSLVVIDMQEVFRHPESQWYVPRYAAAQANIEEILRTQPENVVWTRFVRDPRETGSWRDYYERWDRCREGPRSALWDLTLTAQPTHSVVSAPTFSKWGEELANLTDSVARLVVCGVATDCCVLSTVLGAVDAGKQVTVVSDACAGVTDEAHNQALALLSLLHPMVEIVTTEQFLEWPH
ncbi:cysteine hydrolase family protein [Leucobacter sp. W1153]|uniref:cysteine hydrolase family protein n=1 Tax=Leucobacter sp. W1153 TaxID=3439064 RepID=UPI003F4129E3